MQSKTTTTLTVNPAFLQEIKDSNPELWCCVRKLREACEIYVASSVDPRQLVDLIAELREHLQLQFELEESFGFIECPGAVSHRLCELAEQAHGQHFRLFLQLSDLHEFADELQYRGCSATEVSQLIQETLDFDEALQEHERCESELIDSAYFDQRGI